ncbi:MAG TPA: GNAT family N-acetyltransferase [Acidimicrobiales bacterium]|nr:GNAT family N-acetyltransferase [Acidimicrobiales bacterium]
MRERDRAQPAVKIRPAQGDDTEAIVRLVESAYRGGASRSGWTTEADLLEGQRTDPAQVAEILARPGALILLAADDEGTLVGCCHIEPRPGGIAYFGMFAVDPQRQGLGVGRALIEEARTVATEWGSRELRMTVIRQRDDLLAWYRRLGFLPTGETEPFPYGDERFGKPLRDDLEFVVLAGPVAS